ncbi:MAG TPA: T9SS type A sorting domain-containing protein [Bacteroidia bacterium]|nr:T9SS type A sorting domain-containing protein [Bacteroidia bacterium]
MKKLYIKTLFYLFAIGYSLSTEAQYAWTQKTSFPGNGRTGASCFSIGHYGYVGCGSTASSSSSFTDWWRWDKNTNTWSQITSYPGAAQFGCSYFAIGNKGYAGLGIKGSTKATDLWSYDTTSNTWTQMATFPGVGRYSAFAFVIGTNAYICCGNPGAPPYRADCWKYNSVNNTWTQIADYPNTGIETNLVYSIGKYGYAGCGGNGSANTNTMYKYDTTSNTWTAIAYVPTNGSGLLCPSNFVLQDTAYSVSGGAYFSSDYINTNYTYNPNTNTWGTAARFPGIARYYSVGFSIGNFGYVTTGNDTLGNLLADLWQYGPVSTEGINEISAGVVSMDVFPNPSSGMVNFSYSNLSSGNAKLVITDALGRTVSTYNIGGKKGKLSADESQLSNGVYFYQLNSNGVVLTTGKLLIEK